MHSACDMVQCMGHIQIRNVPEDVHRKLKARAAAKGMSLSEYLLADMTARARVSTPDELEARLRSRTRVRLSEDPAETLRRLRDSS